MFTETIPLSLYIHMPWCIRKCPYCDFNSHTLPEAWDEQAYIDVLIDDLEQDLPRVWGRRLVSIFIGGGTPSLFSAKAYDELFSAIRARIGLPANTEITLEANPGTFEQEKFKDYVQVGINRLSIGVQSFDATALTKLGRIHNDNEARRAIDIAQQAGFNNINVDIMHGLSGQGIDAGLQDLQTAIDFAPNHISWYQLTLEPNTVFYRHPPPLPGDDTIHEMQQQGQALLQQHGFAQYEVSAYAKSKQQCQHNRNYWEYGDYLGIGAGAHSKLTDINQQTISRITKKKQPRAYLDPTQSFIADEKIITAEERSFEFMLNRLRMYDAIPTQLFVARTGLSLAALEPGLRTAAEKGLLSWDETKVELTSLGRRFLNDAVGCFLG